MNSKAYGVTIIKILCNEIDIGQNINLTDMGLEIMMYLG